MKGHYGVCTATKSPTMHFLEHVSSLIKWLMIVFLYKLFQMTEKNGVRDLLTHPNIDSWLIIDQVHYKHRYRSLKQIINKNFWRSSSAMSE
jgi:hypothetical protein